MPATVLDLGKSMMDKTELLSSGHLLQDKNSGHLMSHPVFFLDQINQNATDKR